MTRQELKSFNHDMVLWDGLDDAIVGVAKKEKFGPVIVYDTSGEITLKFDEEYNDFEETDEFEIDLWSREELGPVAVYDINKILDILMKDMKVEVDSLDDGETIESKKYEMALEYYEFNIGCAYVGEYTPIHLYLAEK